MKKVVSVSLGEVVLKGRNRSHFENQLITQMKRAIKDLGYEKIYKEQGKIYIEPIDNRDEEIIERLKKVFGLVYISPCLRVEKNIEDISKGVLQMMEEKITKDSPKTFKVETNRVDKKFDIKSPEMSAKMGGVVLKNFDIKVDVHNPDTYLYIDIKDKVYIYTDRISGVRGMPLATNGKGMLLLSGGIDSPVAGYLMARRGVEISAVHYHSYPFTNKRAEDKVIKLAEILSRYVGSITMYSVNILEIQKAINKNCPASEMTIISRRFMMRIAEELAKKEKAQSLITGENLGQVASQTMEGITVTNDVTSIPVFRPLIGFDKVDIIDIARDIETYETSILPYEDCCTVFLPDNPVIKPRIIDIEKSEEKLDVEKLVKNAIENMEVYSID